MAKPMGLRVVWKSGVTSSGNVCIVAGNGQKRHKYDSDFVLSCNYRLILRPFLFKFETLEGKLKKKKKKEKRKSFRHLYICKRASLAFLSVSGKWDIDTRNVCIFAILSSFMYETTS